MDIIANFKEFTKKFNNEDAVFKKYSIIFKKFWNDLILNDNISSLDDSEIDPIIRLIDVAGKGNRNSIAVAKTMIRQKQWYKAFRSVKENKEIKEIFRKLFSAINEDELIKNINELERKNRKLKNNVTGQKAVILNAFLFLNNPNNYLTALSLEHRNKIIKYLYGTVETYTTFGERIIETNDLIISYFKSINAKVSPRTISCFLYSIMDKWDNNDKDEAEQNKLTKILEKQPIHELFNELFNDIGNGNETIIVKGKKYKRNNSNIVKIKILRGFKCQICGKSIIKKDGSKYIEAAHIKAKSKGGKELWNNIILLCPNHHKEFDLGNSSVLLNDGEKVKLRINSNEYEIYFKIQENATSPNKR
jgi:predicted HNH restriction endonuclease